MIKKSSTKDLALKSNERLFLESKSPFVPKKYSNLKPNKFKIYTFRAGFKKKLDDLLVIVFDDVVNSASAYSKTSTPSAPIIWDKNNNKGKVKALIVNSGNANAHTGKKGIDIINKYVTFLSKLLKCNKSEIFVSSTGVIGELFDPQLIINQISNINNSKTKNIIDAAKSIMTTDTYPKVSIGKTKIENQEVKVYGFAKGSGMISPNMGTMLVYIFVEAKLSKRLLNKLLNNNLNKTFNSISVDSDTSTSDTLCIFSLNYNELKIDFNKIKNFKKINLLIYELMHELSLQVIKDGEGISKLIKVNVKKCKSINQAKDISFSIINSPLVKTAIAGSDANWGRVIMAIGKSKKLINQSKIIIHFGNILVCKNGSKNTKLNLLKLNKYMKNKIIEINVNIQNGDKSYTAYGNDLTYEYIRINADYRS